ncbi:histidine kinase [Flavobacterium rivuli WB 3.3-2 = DSM 21788]|uniref:histidine kinase n=1 Tax=Flavobacterium rivuli WB 3.3-2 = DSM 21788 TaxID=1121895 RepID=A0A0A2M1U7_9FLAO|nr:response regulator [Flavobacterium rivuli]KGO86214.1 histidine kinase [Flavobacterium rivuli WB 3.3-2 = DSM 21788]
MNGTFKRNLIISSGASMLILLVSSIASFVSIRSLLDSNSWVNHTQEVIYNINAGRSELVDAQTSMRGFLVTGNTEFLEQYKNTQEDAASYFANVEELTIDNPKQQASIKELKPYMAEFFKYLQLRIDEKKRGQLSLAADLDAGKSLMDEMRTILKRMENQEQGLLTERVSTSENYGTYSSVLIVVAALIALFISLLFFVRILRDYNSRILLQLALEKSDKETAERIRVISGIAGQISQGNYDVRVEDSEGDALGSVAVSLNNMAAALSSSFKSLSDNEWRQSGIAELNQVMIGEKSLETLTNDIIEYLAVYTNSNAGVLYLLEDNSLVASAGYSYIADHERKRFKIGEGLTGQAVASGKMLELKGIAADDIKISYALGEVIPAHVIAVPLMDNQAEGVVELAAVRNYSKREIEFLKSVANNIGIAIKAAQNRKRVQELLEETQAQSEELKAQHSELEGMNAELEAQTQKLQASEEELRVQQEELQQTNEELAERSVLLEEKNTEIQKKSEDLELTTRYKSEFLANMSHELRTPLNSILLLSRLLSENIDHNMSEEQIEFAKVIQSSGNGLLGLIDEILDLSKIEAGKMELELIDISTKEITDGMKAMFTEVAKQKGIEFKIDDENAPLVIRTDKMRLEQILKNLLSNALKFTSEGSVTLIVKKHATDEKRVLFSVKDTGIGIPREKQPLVFEAFQQADGSTKRKYGGTGLGLSISRELAKLLRGEIGLSSVVDEGSEFTLNIPVIGSMLLQPEEFEDRQIQAPQVITEGEDDDKEKPDLRYRYISPFIPESVPDDRDTIADKDKVVLIVEDDVNFAKSLLEFSRKRGYKGIVSVRGDHALNLAMLYKPAGILLDIQLPIKSGWEVMEDLKNNSQTKHIPVHIMSSHKLKQESLLKGAVNFLDKPVAFEQMPEVFKRIEHIISRESQKVLILEDNPQHAKALAYFLETYNINSEIKSEIEEGVSALKQTDVDCVILDMGIPDRQAYDILESVKKNPGLENLPVIVFTGKSLSMKEELKIKKYADSIVIKTAHSYQRMLDEVSLFLHLVEENKGSEGKKEHYKKLSLLNNVLHNKTVLVVDDDVRNIYSLTKSLESLKMNIVTAIDGKEALKALEEHPEIDVVLLDMMMPNMDGYETATHIRENKKYKTLPVIAVTAKAMTGDREKCINAGASDYITKPVDIDQLLSLLRVWLYDQH